MKFKLKDIWNEFTLTDKVILGTLLLIYLFFLQYIWTTWHFLPMDHLGHILSAKHVSEGNFHEYIQSSFLGNVQNLFYPPLQDFILAIFLKLFQYKDAYRLYISLIFFFYNFSFIFLLFKIKNKYDKIAAFLFLITFWVILRDTEIVPQGLGWFDLFLTGLSNQILSGIFFVLLLYHFLNKRNMWLELIYLTLIINTHLVTALVCLCLFFIEFLLDKNKRIHNFIIVFFSLTVSSYYLVPFFLYKHTLTISIIDSPTGIWFIVPALTSIYLTRNNKQLLSLAILTSIFVFSNCFDLKNDPLNVKNLLPQFHYYRLLCFALLFHIFGLIYYLKDKEGLKPRALVYILIIFSFIPFKYGDHFYLHYKEIPEIDLEPFHKKMSFSKLERTWIMHIFRPISFSYDSKFSLEFEQFNSVKGLYWETHKNNELLTSYIANLDGYPVVLGSSIYKKWDCFIVERVLESFVRDYNIHYLLFPDPLIISLKRRFTRFPYHNIELIKSCMESQLVTGTKFFKFNKLHHQMIGSFPFSLYQIKSRGLINHSLIEIVEPTQKIIKLEEKQDQRINKILADLIKSDKNKFKINHYLAKEEKEELEKEKINKKNDPSFKITKFEVKENKILVKSNKSGWVFVKINNLPGIEVLSNDKKVKHFETYRGIIFYLENKGEISFRKPFSFYLSYFLSIITLLFLLIFRKKLPI